MHKIAMWITVFEGAIFRINKGFFEGWVGSLRIWAIVV